MFGSSTTQNCVHGSDSPESAEREIGILFKDIGKGEQNFVVSNKEKKSLSVSLVANVCKFP